MFKLPALTTRIKLQLLDALWKWSLLGVFLYSVAGNATVAGMLVAISGICLVVNFRVILKPLSYPINTENLIEPADSS